MRSRTQIYIAAAMIAILTIGILGGAAISNYRMAKLERQANDLKEKAAEMEAQAAQKETEAAEYKQKIDSLESQVSTLENTRKQQDERLQALQIRTHDARTGVARARGTRANNDTTVDELCHKLAVTGHGCN